MSGFNYEKALSLEWNGQSFVLTLRNEVTNTYNYAYSSDGKNWKKSILSGTNPSNIKWTGSKFLMDGLSGNNLLASKTGENFSTIPIQGNATTFGIYDLECNLEQSNRITFPQNTTLAVGGKESDTTKIAYSTDSGITWSSATSATGVFSGSCNGAAWNGKLWVAVGSLSGSAGGIGNTIATSPDGITWTGRGAYIFSTAGNAVAWAKELGLWVATGEGTNVTTYSYDGIYWFAGSNTSAIIAGIDVKWNGSVWVLLGNTTTNFPTIYYSFDGKNWSVGYIGGDSGGGSWKQVSNTTNNWVAVRTDATGVYQAAIDASGIIYNTSSVWTSVPTSYATGQAPLGGKAFLAVSGGGAVQYAVINGANNPLWVSTNYGATWTNQVVAAFTGATLGWSGIATNSTGSYILLTSNLATGVGGIWLTSNGIGGTWSKIGGYAAINGCSMSSTGQWQTVVDSYGGVYTSSAYGASGTWSTASAPNVFNPRLSFTTATKIGMSSTGQYMTASYPLASSLTVDAFNMMLSSATNGVMDNSANIYMGGNQSANSQIIYKFSFASGGGVSTVSQIANLSSLGPSVFVNQSMPLALDNLNGVIYFNQAGTTNIYNVVISTGIATMVSSLNASLLGLTPAVTSPSAMVCDSMGNLYIAVASTTGTTAYLCKYTTGGVFSSVTKSVTSGTLSLAIDRSNILYLSYPNQVDQYSSATLVLLQAGFYNSGRFVKYIAFDTTGTGYFYDAGSIVKYMIKPIITNTMYPQTFISNPTTCVLADPSNNLLLLYSNGIYRYNSNNILMNSLTGVTGPIYKMAFDTGYNLYTLTQGSNPCNIYKYTYNGTSLTNVNGSSPYITNTVMTNTQGFVIDSYNNIYVANYGTGTIYRYLSGNTTSYSSYIISASACFALSIDSINTLYWIHNLNSIAIQPYTTSNNNTVTILISSLPYPPYGGTSLDNNGYLYVGSISNCVMKYSISGTLITSNYIPTSSVVQSLYYSTINKCFYIGTTLTLVSSSTLSNQPQIQGLSVPKYSCVDSYGSVYTTNYYNGTVSKYGFDGNIISGNAFVVNPGYIFATGGLNGPFSVSRDSNGYVYAVNQYSITSGVNAVIQYNPNGTVKNSNFIAAYSSSNVNTWGMCIDSNNFIYVSSFSQGKIYQYHINSSGIIDNSNVSFYTGGVNQFQALCVDSYNNIYQTTAVGTIIKLSVSNGTITSTNATFITGAGNIWQIAFDSFNNLYIQNSMSNASGMLTVAKYNSAGVVQTSITLSNLPPSTQGMGIFIRNNILYASTFNASNSGLNMYILSPTGPSYMKTITTGLAYISTLYVDTSNNLFVPVSLNGTGNGGYILKYPINFTLTSNYITGLSLPVGCCVDPNNNLYVCNSGAGTVNQYIYGNTNAITYASGLTNPTSCIIDTNNNFYITTNSSIIKNVRTFTTGNTFTYGSSLASMNLVFDNNNNLYCTFTTAPYVAMFSVSSTSVTFTRTISSTAGCYGVTYFNGYIYICQYAATGYLQKYNISGNILTSNFITMAYPIYCSIDTSGNFYISSFQSSGFISMYNSSGVSLNSSLITGNQPYTTCFDTLGYFYVNWTGTSTITKYALNGTSTPRALSDIITGTGSTRCMRIDSFNNIYVGYTSVNVYSSVSGKIITSFNYPTSTSNMDCGNFDNSGNFWQWQNFTSAGNFLKISFYNQSSSLLINNTKSIAFDISNNFYIVTGNAIVGTNYTSYANLITSNTSVIISSNLRCPLWSYIDISNNLYIFNDYTGTNNYAFVSKYSSSGQLLNGNVFTYNVSNHDIRAFAVDVNGNFYVGDITTGNIAKYNSAGTLLNSSFVTGCGYPEYIIFDSTNTYMYITNNIGAGVIMKCKTDGTNLLSSYITGFGNPNQMAFDSNGFLWVADYNGYIRKCSVTGSTTGSIIQSISRTGGPMGIAFDIFGFIYVSLNQTNTIVKFNPDGTLNSTIVTGLNLPYGLSIDKYGYLYICNQYGWGSTNGSIVKVNLYNSFSGNLVSPNGIAIDSTNNIYVTTGNSVTGISCSKYNSTGTLLNPNYIQGSYITPLGNPTLTMDFANNLYITDASTNTVNIYNTNSLIGQESTLTSFTNSYLTSVYSIPNTTNFFSIDSNTNLYYGQATNANNGLTIYKVTSGLSISTYYSNSATSNLVCDSYTNLYWTTASGNAIVKYNTITQSQSILTDINVGGISLSFLNNPTGLAIDKSNNLYVSSGSSVVKVAYSNPLSPNIFYSGFLTIAGYSTLLSNVAGNGSVTVNFSGIGTSVSNYAIYRNGTNIFNGVTSSLQYYYAFNLTDVSGTNLKDNATGFFDASLNTGNLISSTTYKIGNASLKLSPTANYNFNNSNNIFTANYNINSLVFLSNTTFLRCGSGLSDLPSIGNIITGIDVSFNITPNIWGIISISNSKKYIVSMRQWVSTFDIYINNNDVITFSSTVTGLKVGATSVAINCIYFNFNDTMILMPGQGLTPTPIYLSAWNNGAINTSLTAQPNITYPAGGVSTNSWKNMTTTIDGTRIAFYDNNTLYLSTWNSSNGNYNAKTTIGTSGISGLCSSLQFSADGSLLYLSIYNTGKIYYFKWTGTTYDSSYNTLSYGGGSCMLYPLNSRIYYHSIATATISALTISISYSSQYVTLPSSISVPSTGLSMTAWINPSNATGTIFELANGASSDNIIFGINNTYLTATVYYGTTPYTITDNTTSILSGSWSHVAWTISNSIIPIWTFFVNGVAIVSNFANIVYPSSVVRSLNYIGQSSNLSYMPYSGYIDDFCIYYTAISASNVSSLYSNIVYPFSVNGNTIVTPSYYYAFNLTDVSGTNLIDNTTGFFDASLNTGNLISSTTFKMGTASLNLTPTSSYTFTLINTYNIGYSIYVNRLVFFSNTEIYFYDINSQVYYGVLSNGNWTISQPVYPTFASGTSIIVSCFDTLKTVISTGYLPFINQYNPTNNTQSQTQQNNISTGDNSLFCVAFNNTQIIKVNGSNIVIMSLSISTLSIGTSSSSGIPTNANGYTCIAAMKNGNRVVYSSSDFYVYFATWNGSTYVQNATSVLVPISGQVLITSMILSTDGNLLFISVYNSSYGVYFSYWNGSSYTIPVGVSSTSGMNQPTIQLSPDDSLLYISSGTSLMTYSTSLSFVPQYVTLPTSISIPSSGLSVTAWIKPSNTTATIFELANGASSDNIIFGINNTYLTATVYYGSTPYTITDSTTSLSTSSWSHVAFTISNTYPPAWTFYLNGNVITNKIRNTIYPNVTVRSLNYIGKSTNSSYTPYSGYIDDFRVYYNVLMPSEVNTIYGNTTGPVISRPIYSYIDNTVISGNTYSYSIVAQNPSTTVIPYSIALDSNANIYALLATSLQHTIYKIVAGGGSGTIYYSGSQTNGLYYGYGIAIDTSNNVYVASINSTQTTTSVNRIRTDGSYTTIFSVTGTANPFISGYSGLSIDPYDNLYLSVGNTITKYNISSGSQGSFFVSTTSPVSLAFDASLNAYIMDTSYNVHIDTLKPPSATNIITSSKYGSAGSWVAGNLANPTDITVSGLLQAVVSNGTVYVSTTGGASFYATQRVGCVSVGISQSGSILSTVMTSGSIYFSRAFSNAVGVIWNGQAWINAFSNNTFITSSNGISWNSATVGLPSAPSKLVYSAKSGATLFLTTDSVYSTYTNNYGSLLTGTLPAGIKGNSTVSALLYNGAYYLVGGNVVVTSVDAQTWTKGNAILGMSVINNFVWNTPDQGTASINPITVALGEGNTNTIGYSYDGIQWYGSGSSVFTSRGNKAAWSGQIWCAVGTGRNWVASSYDGIVWTGRNTYMMTEGYDIAWNGLTFVAVGVGTTPIVTSPNGINWYPVANSSTLFTNYVSSIVWTGFVWIAYGSSVSGPVVGICTNPNGTIWTTKTVTNLSVTPRTRPIVTKTNVLHPLTTTSGTTYLYSTADLYGNSVSGNVNILYPINDNLTGLKMPVVTASVFDGYNYLVVDVSGNGSIITNQASNTNLVFNSTYAGSALATNLTMVNGGAYNGRVVMLGGTTTGVTGNTVITYNTFGTGTASQFFAATSANSIFTQVNGLASNSGYGPVYVANALYLNVGDKLSIVGPKAYSQTIAPTTSITMNLMNTTTNPQNIKTVYPSITPTK